MYKIEFCILTQIDLVLGLGPHPGLRLIIYFFLGVKCQDTTRNR